MDLRDGIHLGSTSADILPPLPPDQREHWNRWHARHDHASHEQHARDARELFLSVLPPALSASPERILDIGCGQGRDAIALVRAGMRVVAMDHSSVALARARAALPDGNHIEWVERDYGAQGVLFDGTFDAIYAHLSLHYFTDKATRWLFEDIARALNPGGLLFFTVRSTRDGLHGMGDRLAEDYFCYEGHIRRFFSEDYVGELLSDWCGVNVETYDPEDRIVNPGTFIRAWATRPMQGS